MARKGKDIEFPEFDWDSDAQEVALQKLKDVSDKCTLKNLVGYLYSQQVGDGYAYYVVESTKPLVLCHVPYSDNWEANLRGINLNSVKSAFNWDKTLKGLKR